MSLFENPLKRLADFESLEENIKKRSFRYKSVIWQSPERHI